MKPSGYIRKIDSLGRFVIPKELRKKLNINVNDKLFLYSDNKSLILKKYKEFCIFCDGVDDIMTYKNKKICGICRSDIKNEK